MVADVGDPAGWVANRDINQVFVEFSMGGLDDGKGLGDFLSELLRSCIG